MRQTLEDCPSISISPLRAKGVVRPGMPLVRVTVAGLTRVVRLHTRHFPSGGSWSLWLCPECDRRARILRVYDGRLVCQWCVKLPRRAHVEPRSVTLARKVESLKKLLNGAPVRLRPRKNRLLDRRPRLQVSLRRARILLRVEALKRARSAYHAND
jgi:hypothetical protein